MARLLIVDDEADIRAMLRDALVLRGHQVDVADGANEAVELSKTTAYDVAIIDYVLPGMRGLELLRRLRGNCPFIRSIIISGELDHDELDTKTVQRQLRERVDADNYFEKPVSAEDLNQAIKMLCEPLGGQAVDWQKIAENAVTGKKVKAKDIAAMDQELRRKRKKQRK